MRGEPTSDKELESCLCQKNRIKGMINTHGANLTEDFKRTFRS